MKEYRKVVELKFHNNKYNMYLDSSNKRFFLKVNDDGKLSYITIEELFDLIKHFSTVPNVMNINKDSARQKIKIIPKIIIGGTAVTLSLSMLMTGLSMYNSHQRVSEFEQRYSMSHALDEEEVQSYVSGDIESNSEEAQTYVEVGTELSKDDLVVDTYLESDWLNYVYIYDMNYINRAFDNETITLEMLYQAIDSNPSISGNFKDLLYEYCDSVVQSYPNIELRVLYENLKTLKVVECDQYELSQATLNIDASGCYIRTENKIYVLKDKEYEKGTWDYQVIFHELSHCLRTGVYDIDGKKVKVQVEGQNFSNTITAEALNSLFTVSLFDYEENDIAYQLQSNYHKVIIDCMDNYDLSDYVNHSLSYYAHQLDEFNGDENYATVILELIQMQYDDFHSESLNVDPIGYYPIYDYISNMYFNKYITSDMSYDEARAMTDQLVDTILFDVPEDYNIDTTRFYDNLNNYCAEVGISANTRSR